MSTQEKDAHDGTAVPKAQRRRRASTGGFRHKLDAPERKGFVRRWVDNDPSRIAAMEELGYAMVADRAGEGASRTEGLGTRIQRHGGKRDSGEAQNLVLMECLAEDYQLGVQEKEDRLKPFEEAIRRGADTTGQMSDAYQPNSARSSITHSS